MMQINEMDELLNTIQNEDIDTNRFLKVTTLLEKKIHMLSGMDDLKGFKTYVEELNLPKSDKLLLVHLRNTAVHNPLKIETELKDLDFQNWMANIIIPAILSYKAEIAQVNDIHTLKKRIATFGSESGFEVKFEASIPIGRLRKTADMIFEDKEQIILFEFKESEKHNAKDLGKQQLMSLIAASNSRVGVLVLPGDYYDIFQFNVGQKNCYILIFGNLVKFKFLKSWIASSKHLNVIHSFLERNLELLYKEIYPELNKEILYRFFQVCFETINKFEFEYGNSDYSLIKNELLDNLIKVCNQYNKTGINAFSAQTIYYSIITNYYQKKGKLHRLFIIHGNDNEMLESVVHILEKQMITPIILRNIPSLGTSSILEKLEKFSDVSSAIFLLSKEDLDSRSGANLMFELGYFLAKLGRERIIPIVRQAELPFDILGMLYINFESENWVYSLLVALEKIGYGIV